MLYRKTALRVAAPVAVLALALTACGGGGDKDSAGTSKGGVRATGESATGEANEGLVSVVYDVTAQKVELGTEAETAKMVSEPKLAKGLIPAVAHVKYTHESGPTLTQNPRASQPARIWADGRRGTLIVGAADHTPGCEAPSSIKDWKQGETHVLCETYLVPKDTKNLEVHWSQENGEPFIWKFAATDRATR
ncbi:hypothetical protein ACFVXC_01835 [Streptomyces sp. NPDC058257]|uniref:hypothetical protein n=1 Tax=Streptomyces sp. NPDC058257 TaxID=3346409 RepID=UPI0036E5E0BF